MAKNKVDINGVNTSSLKVLKNDEMTDLFVRYKAGDKYAKELLICGNLKLVLSILKKFQNRIDNMDDLFQIGCVGLIKAIDNFDMSFDVKFSTYAVPMILGEIKRFLRDNNSIKVSRSIKDLVIQISKKREELTLLFGREPNDREIATSLGITEYELSRALDSSKELLSMSEPIYNDGTDPIYLQDQIEDKKDTLFDLETRLALKDALTKIKDKEKYVLYERYIYGKTQVELAEELGISQAQISRIEKSGISDIKKLIL